MTAHKLDNSEYIELMKAGSIISIIDTAFQKGYQKGHNEGYQAGYEEAMKEQRD